MKSKKQMARNENLYTIFLLHAIQNEVKLDNFGNFLVKTRSNVVYISFNLDKLWK